MIEVEALDHYMSMTQDTSDDVTIQVSMFSLWYYAQWVFTQITLSIHNYIYPCPYICVRRLRKRRRFIHVS